MLKIRTVGDLKQYISQQRVSPELLSREVAISNMTIRRLMRKPNETPIPQKYWAQFDRHSLKDALSEGEQAQLLSPGAELHKDFEQLISDLEASGSQPESDLAQMRRDLQQKSEQSGVGSVLKERALVLLKTAIHPQVTRRYRAIALGALLYFINPVDMIPDAMLGMGYLDDLAVVTVAISAILPALKESQENGPAGIQI